MSVLNVGDKVAYKYSNMHLAFRPSMRVEFIDGDAVTCSYLDSDERVKTIVLNASSLEKSEG